MNWESNLQAMKTFAARGLFHAALDVSQIHSAFDEAPPSVQAEYYDELGKLHTFLGNSLESISDFSRAISLTTEIDAWAKYNVHLAVAYRRLSEYDTAYRYLNKLVPFQNEVSALTRGLLFLNLSAVEGINGFYDEVIQNTQISLKAFSEQPAYSRYHVSLYNNLGLAHLERGDFAKAERYLKQALALDSATNIDILAELGRLYMLQSNVAESVSYAQAALTRVWSRIISYEKEEIARLCHLLAQLSYSFGERSMALRLNEKAQLFFGQLGMWRHWQEIDSEMLDWEAGEGTQLNVSASGNTISFVEIRHFLDCLDAMNSQEITDKLMGTLMDTRAHYAALLAAALQCSDGDVQDLVLAARLCDYGLTALEPEVATQPGRSSEAFAQYRLHPELGARMAQTLKLPERVIAMIRDHHEQVDGGGYPAGKGADDITPLAKTLAVVDAYVQLLVIEGKSHTASLACLNARAGTAFDESVVHVFQKMFEV